MKKYPTLLFVIAFSSFAASAQLEVNDQISAEYLVEEIFQGSGVTISNVTINGLAGTTMMPSMGNYSYEGELAIPPVGILLASGGFTNTWGMGSGYSNEPDLMILSGTNIFDAMVLEFDFVPEEDTMVFEYVFASTEYTSFTCTPFNDAFGFFLSGPNISGPFQNNARNIALVPGTEIPISINTVNSGQPSNSFDEQYCDQADPNWQSNSVYFVADTTMELLSYNGLTVILQAISAVVPGEVYHIKLAISDASDSALDSGIFLQAASFRSVASLATLIAREQAAREMHAWFNAEGGLVLDAGDTMIDRLRVYDAQGKMVQQTRVGSTGLITVPAMDLKSGLYILEAGTEATTLRSKVLRH